MDYNQLKTDIAAVIRTNGNEEITGEVLQYVLLMMVSALGKDFQFAGVGTISTSVGEPDENMAWILRAGHYENFGEVPFDVEENEFAVVMYDGTFSIVKVPVGRKVDDMITEQGINPVESQAIAAEFKKLRDAGYLFAGLATRTSTPPQNLTEKIFYICVQGGTYENFNNLHVNQGLNVLMFNGSTWIARIIFDILDDVDEASEGLVMSKGIYTALGNKVDKEDGMGLSQQSFTTEEKNKLNNLPTALELAELLAQKQNVLEFDNAPTQGSSNPVTSAGIHEAIKDFITKAVNDLVNYYTKSQTYNKTEVDALIAAIKQFKILAVQELPQASENTMGTLYFVPADDPQQRNIKDEYITLSLSEGGSTTYYWEKIGTTEIDLSNYTTFDDVNAAIATALEDYYTKTETDAAIAEAIGAIADLALETNVEVILTNNAVSISVTGRSQVAAETLTITRAGYQVGTGSGTVITAIDVVNVATAGNITYLLTAVIGGVTRTKEIIVSVVDPIYYGAGATASAITTKASARKTPAGRYNFTAAAGDSLFVICPVGMSVQGMRMSGIDIPLEGGTGMVIDEKSYLCYQSSNVYDAGNYVIEVY